MEVSEMWVVVIGFGRDAVFWTGNRWSSMVDEARVYPDWPTARGAIIPGRTRREIRVGSEEYDRLGRLP